MGISTCFLLLHLPARVSAVEGQVTDSQNTPLVGVSVLVKGSSLGVVTDLAGRYAIQPPSENATLVFSFLGFAPEERVVGTQPLINVTLYEASENLEEIVVVAYGTQRKKDLTGAISVVDTKMLEQQLVPGIGQALQGLAAGVHVTTSGAPGSAADISIRGIGSLSSVSPLYVIDGMILEGSQREFNMNDVESIQILKDAAAASLYGARGANGVILITTKKGKEGLTKIDFTASLGVSQIAKRIEAMNSVEFLRINRLAYQNANKEWPGEPAQGQVLINTDWQDEFFKIGLTKDYNLNVSGGNPNGNYMISFDWYNQDGVVVGPSYERFTVRSNAEARKGIFTIGENLMIGRSITLPMIDSPFIDLARMPPVIPVRDPSNPEEYSYGSANYQTYGTNPVGLQETRDNTQYNNRLIGTAYLQVEPIKNLQLKTSLGVEYFGWFDRYKPTYKQLRYLNSDQYETSLQENKGDMLSWIWESTAFYKNKLGEHSFDAMLGYTAQKLSRRGNSVTGYNMVTDGLWVLDQASPSADFSVDGSDSDFSMTSILARINYSYAERYLLQLNVRRDGSSRFGANYRFGYYPSASFGWRISEEDFFEPVQLVNDLKLRVSYGVLGDQQAVGDYKFATYVNPSEGAVFGAGGQAYVPGKIQKGRANPDLRWEEKTTFNVGIDFVLLNQHLYGTVEYFDARLNNLLQEKSLAWISGTDESPWSNYGSMNNKGVEALLGFRDRSHPFKYDVSANVSGVRNKVTGLARDQIYFAGISGSSATEVGRSIGEFYVLRTDGIFQNWNEVYAHSVIRVNSATGEEEAVLIQPNAAPGDIRYKDINPDGVISEEDREYIGSPLPKLEGGVSFSCEYKGFDLNLFFFGVYGNMVYNNVKFWMERMDETANLPKDLKPWTGEGASTTTPRPYMGPTDNTIGYSDRWIERGDYIRLKNAQLGYTLSPALLKKTHVIEKLRIYAGAQNLLTLTGYSGFDPEISGGGVFGKGYDDGHFPPVRTVTFGLQIGF
ncbi:MAG: TonB-dependent receptor [Prevotellaceae bacterium]|nr:TonB-dependent receptor [Prevotellaceae bacterium]